MASYNNINDLLNGIKKQVQDVAQKEVKQTIRKTMEKHIDEDVYEVYQPYGKNPYERRYEDQGLADSDNIDINIQDNSNGVNIVTTNTTKANGDDLGEPLTPYIEEGIYNWAHKPPKRPFIEKTTEELKDGVLEKALKDGLNKRGLNTK